MRTPSALLIQLLRGHRDVQHLNLATGSQECIDVSLHLVPDPLPGTDGQILGTVAVENPDLVRTAAGRYPGRIAVGIDARQGRVATKGWAEDTGVDAADLARSFEDAGVAAIIYTDINRDGAMQGPNIEATAALARAVDIPVIASGGVSSVGIPSG